MPWFRNLIQFSATTFRTRSSSAFVKPNYNLNVLLNYRYSVLHFSTATTEKAAELNSGVESYAGLRPTEGNEKPRVVVLGSGWAACRLMKDIDTKIYDVVCVSPRNHMVFTPLLASTCVGTLEFRSVAEPINRIQPAISKEPGSYFFLAKSTGVDFHNHQVCHHPCFPFLASSLLLSDQFCVIWQCSFFCVCLLLLMI